MTDQRGTPQTGTAAPAATDVGATPTIATAALLGAAQRVLSDVLNVPAPEVETIMRGLSRLAHHLFGHRTAK